MRRNTSPKKILKRFLYFILEPFISLNLDYFRLFLIMLLEPAIFSFSLVSVHDHRLVVGWASFVGRDDPEQNANEPREEKEKAADVVGNIHVETVPGSSSIFWTPFLLAVDVDREDEKPAENAIEASSHVVVKKVEKVQKTSEGLRKSSQEQGKRKNKIETDSHSIVVPREKPDESGDASCEHQETRNEHQDSNEQVENATKRPATSHLKEI